MQARIIYKINCKHTIFIFCSIYYHFDRTVFRDLCEFHPCEHGATCIVDENGSTFTCLCVPGYVGKVCSTGKLYLLVPINGI